MEPLLIRRLVLAAAAAIVLAVPQAASAQGAACTRTWDGGGGNVNWSVAANWDADTLPGAADVVCVTTGAGSTVNAAFSVKAVHATTPLTLAANLTLDDAAETSEVDTLTLGPGDIQGDGDIEIGTLTWNSSGRVDGAGTMTVEGTATVSGAPIGTGRTVVFEGPSVVNGNFSLAGTAVFENRGAMTGTIGDSWSGTAVGSDVPKVVNAVGASITKTGGGGNANIGGSNLRVLNLGTMADTQPDVAGYLGIDGTVPDPGTPSTGIFDGVRIQAAQELGPGVTLDDVAISGDVTYPYDTPLTITDLRLEGAFTTWNAPLTLVGTVRLWFGRIHAPRIVQPAGGVWNQEAAAALFAPRVEIGGTYNLGGTGCGSPVNLEPRTVWDLTGTLNITTASCTWLRLETSPPDEAARLVNRGAIVKTGTGGATIDMVIVNDGLVDVQSGTLTSRRFEQTPDGTLRFDVHGASAGSGYGVLSSTALRYSGRLEAVVSGGYAPAPNARHNVIAASLALRSGLFHSTSLAGFTLDETGASNIGLVQPATRLTVTAADSTPPAAAPSSAPLGLHVAPLAPVSWVPAPAGAPALPSLAPATKQAATKKRAAKRKKAKGRRARSRAARARSRRASPRRACGTRRSGGSGRCAG